jgi:DNA primase
VAGIRDPAMRPGYSRRLAKMLGIDLVQVEQAVRAARGTSKNAPRRLAETRAPVRAADQRSRVPAQRGPAPGQFEEEPPFPDGEGYDFPPDASDFGGGAVRAVRMSDLPNDPVTRLERDTLMAVLQHPRRLSDERFQQVMAAGFTNASLSTVRDGIVATRDSLGSMEWITRIGEEVPQAFTTLVTELAMASIPAGNKDEQIDLYVRSLSASLVERDLLRRKAELLGALQRTDGRTEPDRFRSLNEQLVSIENQKRELREG